MLSSPVGTDLGNSKWEETIATLNGIDISSWQTGIDPSAVPADFVIVKATEAMNYVNSDCDRALQQAMRAGKLLGVYHFARPGDARAQADFFIAKCKGYIGRGVLVLDWEANALPLGPTWAKVWLDRVYQVTGIRPLIYMSASVTGQYDWTAVVKANYGLWVSAYPLGYQRIDGYRVPSGPKGVKHWPIVAIWQYTSSGRLSGWGGNLDLNVFHGDRAAWAKYAGGATVNPSANVDSRDRTKTDNQLMLDIDGDPQAKTYSRFQQVMGTPIDGVKSQPSPMITAFQRFLNTVVSNKDIKAITGYEQLDEDGIDGWRTWKVFQYWAWNVRKDLIKAYANGQSVWQFADGIPGVRTWKVLQHILNESYANSGKLLKK